jgi:hypothetical protein
MIGVTKIKQDEEICNVGRQSGTQGLQKVAQPIG